MNLRFPSKVLLFGEYAVLEGSEALAGPLPEFYGVWTKEETELAIPDIDIKELIDHIQKLIDNRILTFNISEMQEDWEDGWRFATNIPVGYGLGSSGAFTAALYQKYGNGDFLTMAPNKVKRHMALIESFFHGESSGIDPTISLYGKAIHNAYEWKFVEENIFDPIKDNGLRFFLYDSGEQRKAKSLIAHFKTQTTSPTFRSSVLEPLVQANRKAIRCTLSGDNELWTHFQQLSEIQFHHFEPMIAESVISIWADSLSQSIPHLLKICGAGGGGYYLGLSKNIDDTMRSLGIDRVIML